MLRLRLRRGFIIIEPLRSSATGIEGEGGIVCFDFRVIRAFLTLFEALEVEKYKNVSYCHLTWLKKNKMKAL